MLRIYINKQMAVTDIHSPDRILGQPCLAEDGSDNIGSVDTHLLAYVHEQPGLVRRGATTMLGCGYRLFLYWTHWQTKRRGRLLFGFRGLGRWWSYRHSRSFRWCGR